MHFFHSRFFAEIWKKKLFWELDLASKIHPRLYSFRPLIYRTWILEENHPSTTTTLNKLDHPGSSCGSIHHFWVSQKHVSFLRKENSAAKSLQNPFMKYLKPSSLHSLGSFVWCIEFPPSMPGRWNSSRQLGRWLGKWQRCLGDKIPPFWKDQTWCKFTVGSFIIVHCLGW